MKRWIPQFFLLILQTLSHKIVCFYGLYLLSSFGESYVKSVPLSSVALTLPNVHQLFPFLYYWFLPFHRLLPVSMFLEVLFCLCFHIYTFPSYWNFSNEWSIHFVTASFQIIPEPCTIYNKLIPLFWNHPCQSHQLLKASLFQLFSKLIFAFGMSDLSLLLDTLFALDSMGTLFPVFFFSLISLAR